MKRSGFMYSMYNIHQQNKTADGTILSLTLYLVVSIINSVGGKSSFERQRMLFYENVDRQIETKAFT